MLAGLLGFFALPMFLAWWVAPWIEEHYSIPAITVPDEQL